jgi:hypothetical protein
MKTTLIYFSIKKKKLRGAPCTNCLSLLYVKENALKSYCWMCKEGGFLF